MSPLTYLKTIDEWNTIAKKHEELKNILVVCASASWCGPCKALAPKLEALANTYDENVLFFKVDIEEMSDFADKFNIASIPTTLIFKNCNIYKTVTGADIVGIKSGIDNALFPEPYQ